MVLFSLWYVDRKPSSLLVWCCKTRVDADGSDLTLRLCIYSADPEKSDEYCNNSLPRPSGSR